MEPNKDILKHIKSRKNPAVDSAYFEAFQANMLAEIKKHPNPDSKREKVFYLRPLFWVASTAAAVIFVFGVRMFSPNEQTNLASVSQEEIENYLDEHEKESVWEVVEEPEETPEINSVPQTEKQTAKEQDKNIEVAATEGFVSSASLLDEISSAEIYQYIESEEFDLEELDYSQF